jgi:hypothetical protein
MKERKIMNKYPKRPVDENDNPNIFSGEEWYAGYLFRCGCAHKHARYLIEMSRRHPVMYWIWYRWWIPSLLHEDEHEKLDHAMKYCKKFEFRSYWADFALYHPVQFLVFLLLAKTWRAMTKSGRRIWETCFTKKQIASINE